MFVIYDGREKFYQWDKDRKLIINSDSITEVHYANCICTNAKVCKVYDLDGKRVADVPNELLTIDLDIKVWGYDGEATKHSTTFEVEKKVKPDDYIYTPTELYNYETVLDIAEDAKDVADSVRADADAGLFNGEKGEKGDNNTVDTAIGAYPWSSKKIVDTLCLPIEETGAVVACEPVEGYPLEIVADENATTITQCGKNLWNFKSGVSVVNYTTTADVYTERYGYRVKLPAGTYTAHAELVKNLGSSYQYVYGYIVKDNGDMVRTAHLVAAGDVTTRTITLKQDECYLICHGYSMTSISESQANKLFNEGWNIQIEVGKTKTPYEAYSGNTFAIGETIAANSGVNYLFVDSGNITVKGRENPQATFNKLTQAIISTGGNL
jgi:hypothetical protein